MESHVFKHTLSVKGEQPFRVPSDCFLISPLPAGGTYVVCIVSIFPGQQINSPVKQIDEPLLCTCVNTHVSNVELKITGVPANHTFHIKY